MSPVAVLWRRLCIRSGTASACGRSRGQLASMCERMSFNQVSQFCAPHSGMNVLLCCTHYGFNDIQIQKLAHVAHGQADKLQANSEAIHHEQAHHPFLT